MKDRFEIARIGKITKTSMILGRYNKKVALLAALELQFGFNLKSDAPKNKQLKLW